MKAARERGVKRPVIIPIWAYSKSGKPAPANRHCTGQFKIDVLNAEVKRKMGFRKGASVKGKQAAAMIGISIDEASRMRDSSKPWIQNLYPLIDARMDRQACVELVEEHGLGTPKRSACVYCPFMGYNDWRNLKENHPKEWARALEMDELLEIEGITPDPCYLTPLMKRLRDLEFSREQLGLFGEMWDNECAGVCGV